jgi:hypothetical protein
MERLDLARLDPKREVIIPHSLLHHGWEGQIVTGWPVATFVCGECVFDRGEVLVGGLLSISQAFAEGFRGSTRPARDARGRSRLKRSATRQRS